MNKIYYFTGSGNSLSIAKRIAEKFENCELIRVSARLDFTTPVKAETLGFVFPVYAWGMPLLFKEFMQQIQISHASYTFVITNYAGSCGNALGYFNNICKKKNIRIDAFGEIVMPSNYVTMGNAASKGDAIKVLEKAEPELRSLVEDIASGKQRPLRKPKLTSKLLTAVVYPLFTSNIRKSDKTFFFTENCTGCGICLKVCPVENIKLNNKNRPVWLHKCEQCHACLHWCPQQAIEFNKKTSTKNRYTHPDIALKEMVI